MNEDQINLISEKIIACAFKVHNTLGSGFLEKVYENALKVELKKEALGFESQKLVNVYYSEELVGEFFIDILVENKIILELKAIKYFNESNFAQCLNYLKATKLPFCLLINFGEERVKIKRFLNPFLNLKLRALSKGLTTDGTDVNR